MRRDSETSCTVRIAPVARTRAFRRTKIAAALLAIGLLRAAGSVAATFESEPNDTLASADAAFVGSAFMGSVQWRDPNDFLMFGGLDSNAIYALHLTAACCDTGSEMLFDLYRNGSTSVSQTLTITTLTFNRVADLAGLTGLTSLGIGVRTTTLETVGEGYTATLNQTGTTSVPEPATLALIGAGLAGAAVRRRRPRG